MITGIIKNENFNKKYRRLPIFFIQFTIFAIEIQNRNNTKNIKP